MQNTDTTGNELIDILGAIELPDEILNRVENTFIPKKMVKRTFTVKIKFKENKINTQKNETILENIEKKSENISEKIKTNIKVKSNFLKQFLHTSIFGVKYILTSLTIFGVLLVSSNFSAYSNIVESYIFEDQHKESASSLLNSVNAGEIKEKEIIYKKTKSEKIEEFKQKTKKVEKIKNTFSIKQIISSSEKKDIDLGISIVPYENRIVIPKINKNVPLIDIKETTVESKNKLDNILMKELEDGVVRYPGSAKPGQKGNSFIFGHSSNFPWIAGNYNEVFSRLGQVEIGDIVYSYYGQKKYKYIIKEKKVVKPTDIGVLKNDQEKKQLTLMTCWPVGTTLNRLILTAELIEE